MQLLVSCISIFSSVFEDAIFVFKKVNRKTKSFSETLDGPGFECYCLHVHTIWVKIALFYVLYCILLLSFFDSHLYFSVSLFLFVDRSVNPCHLLNWLMLLMLRKVIHLHLSLVKSHLKGHPRSQRKPRDVMERLVFILSL